MQQSSLGRGVLLPLISVLALADGVLHVALDYVLFNGKLWGAPSFGPPPGGPPGGPGGPPAGPPPGPPPANPILQAFDIAHITGLPLNELFLLNVVGYVVLVLALWTAPRWLGRWSWLMDIVLIGYALASIISWLAVGAPNPHGLGYLSKVLEVALIVALVAHLWTLVGRRSLRALPAG